MEEYSGRSSNQNSKFTIFRNGDGDVLCECVQNGINIKFGRNDSMWCCKTTEDECISEDYTTNTKCNGITLSLSDQCHDENNDGPSCNYYPLDRFRYRAVSPMVYRSYVDLCQDNR